MDGVCTLGKKMLSGPVLLNIDHDTPVLNLGHPPLSHRESPEDINSGQYHRVNKFTTFIED